MPWNQQTDIWGLVGAFIISTVSGFISISRRIMSGQKATWLWLISEYLTAILCGCLMYNTYPFIQKDLPEWITLPVAIAVAAHIGGRVFQEAEAVIFKRILAFKRQ